MEFLTASSTVEQCYYKSSLLCSYHAYQGGRIHEHADDVKHILLASFLLCY